jgi:PTH1 family peptidyl-tRNA hydrolase
MEETPIRLIAGLGNPGRDYAKTRHNIGFLVLDRMASHAGVTFAREKKWQAEVARLDDLWLVKPQTFMNLSGAAVGSVGAFYRIEPASCLVVYDDKDLPFGRLRLRSSGSAGGHNGVKSLISHLGTEDFPRLRFGIGPPERTGPGVIDHVLGGFAPIELEGLEKRLDRAVEALNYAARHGFTQAMNYFNRPEESPPAAPSAPDPPPIS